jgi:hypothetical protein
VGPSAENAFKNYDTDFPVEQAARGKLFSRSRDVALICRPCASAANHGVYRSQLMDWAPGSYGELRE